MKNINVTPTEIYFLVKGKDDSIFIEDYLIDDKNELSIIFSKKENDALQFLQYNDANEVKKFLKEKYNINLLIKRKQIKLKDIHYLKDTIEY